MAIRRISDLPYLTEDEMKLDDAASRTRLMNSGLELSYLNNFGTQASDDATYVSRFIQMQQLTSILLADITYGDTNFDGNKTFTGKVDCLNGIDVGKFMNLTGDMNVNVEGQPAGSGDLRFSRLQITSTDGVSLKPTASVDTTDDSNDKSVVNVGYMKDYLDDMRKSIDDKLKEVDEALATIGQTYVRASNIWPVGALYMSTISSETCPVATLIEGSEWQKIQGRYILGSGQLVGAATTETYNAGATVASGAPTVKCSMTLWGSGDDDGGAYFTFGKKASSTKTLTAESTGNVYGKSKAIRPPAIVVDIWKRTK